MKSLVLGAYSSYPQGSDSKFFSQICDTQIAPLLKFLYQNAHYKFSLYLSAAQLEWVEKNRPEVNRLISRLVKRKTLSLLASSYYQSFLPLSNPAELVREVEYMRSEYRKLLRIKPRGFFNFSAIWSDDLISRLLKYDINYAVIPTLNHSSVLSSGPFMMPGYGRKFVVYPSCDFTEKIYDYAYEKISYDRFQSDFEKYLSRPEAKNLCFFINIDKLLHTNSNISDIVSIIFSIMRSSGYDTITTDDDYCFKKYYLPSSSYILDDTYIGSLLDDNIKYMRVLRINFLRKILNERKIVKKQDKETLYQSFMKIKSSSLFFNEYSSVQSAEEIYKDFLDNLSGYTLKNFTCTLDDFDTVAVKTKNYISFADTSDATVKEFGEFKNGVNFLEGGFLFRDLMTDARRRFCLIGKNSFAFEQVGDKGELEFTLRDDYILPFDFTKKITFTDSKIGCSITFLNQTDRDMTINYGMLSYLKGTDLLEKIKEGKETDTLYLASPSQNEKITIKSDTSFKLEKKEFFTDREINELLSDFEGKSLVVQLWEIQLSAKAKKTINVSFV